LVTAASASADGRRPSGEIAAACARPQIVIPASVTTRAAVNDTIKFFIEYSPRFACGANTTKQRQYSLEVSNGRSAPCAKVGWPTLPDMAGGCDRDILLRCTTIGFSKPV
jgi:hypothetical protein